MLDKTGPERITQETLLLGYLRRGSHTTNALCAVHYISDAGRHISLARELTRIISVLRRKGFVIHYHHGKGGSGWYELVNEPPVVAPSGQLVLASCST